MDTSYEVDTVAVPPLIEVMLVVVYTDMSSASSCALSIFPTTYPFFDRAAITPKAVAHTVLPLTEITSDGENDDSNEDTSVCRREDDPSCLAATEITA